MTRKEYVTVYAGDGVQDTVDLAHVVRGAVEATGWRFRFGHGNWPEMLWVFRNRFDEDYEVVIRKREKA